LVDLGGADEQGQASFRADKAQRNRQRSIEALDGTEGHEVGRGGGKVFSALVEDLDVCEAERANDFAEEGCLLIV
jgi:hypothetical protein